MDMQLNKFLAHAGICSRRKAEELIKKGVVAINGRVERTCGYRVMDADTVTCMGKKVTPESKVYILLNKPTDYITTVSDDYGRQVLVDLVPKSFGRVYPVGRLDMDTSGLIVLTNDGELAQHLAHPRFQVTKAYVVKLDRPMTSEDFNRLQEGVMLEDGFIRPDALTFVGRKNHLLRIEIHCGKNRIVRRMFTYLGYRVHALARVEYAGISDRTLAQGRWRFLSRYEVKNLQRLSGLETAVKAN